MRKRLVRAIMVAMNRPLTASRVLLVADRRDLSSELRTAPLRRYRLARLRLDGRELTSPAARRTRATPSV
jgi:hypothetical protein